jgi:DNA-binding transcriptional MerR regulator
MLIAIRKVAKMFGVTCQTIRNWEAQGIFSTSKTIGKHRRFELEEVERVRGIKKEDERITMVYIRE